MPAPSPRRRFARANASAPGVEMTRHPPGLSSRAEGQKRFPVLDSLALPCGALRASVELFCAPIDGYRNATSREWGGG
jgi:hypothetical protein